jgi:3-hydroxyacyl-[acyl-carrier-protein] dehydratase
MPTDKMLRDNFYFIKSLVNSENNETIKSTIEFNKDHAIFGGHFPGAAVVPGVCMIYILKDIMRLAFKKELRLWSADNIKFTAALEPHLNLVVDFEVKTSHLADGSIQVVNQVHYEDVTFLKFTGIYK